MAMPSSKPDLLPGTLDMLVLKVLSAGPMHGYGIAQHVARESDELLHLEEGSLYPALQRMRQRGWVKAAWGKTPNNQRARYYTITPDGETQLGVKQAEFADMLRGIARIMRSA